MREQNMTSLNRLSLRIRESLQNRIGAGFRSAFRRSGLMLSLCLAGISWLAEAGTVTVDARGRDLATAETNARLNATREVMNAMAGPEFVKSQMKRIRAEIIARPQDFTGKVSILKQQKSGKHLIVRADQKGVWPRQLAQIRKRFSGAGRGPFPPVFPLRPLTIRIP